MPRYYFDMRDGGVLCPDEEGLELADWRAAEIEAAMSLAGMAKDLSIADRPYPMGIEVRTDEGAFFQLAFVFETASRDGKRTPRSECPPKVDR